jgi:hypothetical protein
MGKNSKPILSILVDESKKEQFADLARRSKYSMAWLLNDCIDRMLAADSIDVYENSMSNSGIHPNSHPTELTQIDIEEIIKTSISNMDLSSIGANDIEEAIKTYVDKVLIPISSQIETVDRAVIDLESYAQSQFKVVEAELKALNIQVVSASENKSSTIAAKSYACPQDPMPWNDQLAELVRTGISTTEIAIKLTEMGYTNSKGEAVSRKSIEGKFKSRPDLKEIYDKARTKK